MCGKQPGLSGSPGLCPGQDKRPGEGDSGRLIWRRHPVTGVFWGMFVVEVVSR
jgi:hypothetical protein